MRNLLRADLYRLFGKRWLWLCAFGMVALAIALMGIQHTAMDYSVALDRVIFLPMAFYGVVAAALTGVFVGTDFADGVVRSKLASGASRTAVYVSAQIACWLGCLTVYLLTTLTTIAIGTNLFAVHVTAGDILVYTLLGMLCCLAYGSIFCMLSMSIGNRSIAVAACMLSAFLMLFLCLHTNQVLMQAEFVDGALNPAYVGGAKRILYEYLHDINPSGQAAQLSSMHCLSAVRFVATDVFWIVLSLLPGPLLFGKQDIR